MGTADDLQVNYILNIVALYLFTLEVILSISYKDKVIRMCALYYRYCIRPDSSLCVSPIMTLHNNYFVPTTVKEAGRK